MEEAEPSHNSDKKAGTKTDVLRDFQVSFFAMRRLDSFPWTFLEKDLESNKSSDLISEILEQTCLHSRCRKFPPSQEAAGCDPLDQLYDALAEVVGAEETADGYKSYFLPSGDAVSVLENVALISEGTTGLVTWKAAFYLAEWALAHRQAFAGRTVLELGSGMGLTGITICRSCSPDRYVFSDCHSSVLQKLRNNVQLNGLAEQTPPAVSVEAMEWTEATEEQLRRIGADIVIAADVAYDPHILGGLVEILSKTLRRPSPEVLPEVLICSSIRNQETYSSFKQQLETAGISHQVIDGAVSQVFPYSRVPAIELIRLYR